MVRKVPIEIEKEIVEKYWDYTAKELGEIYNIKPNTIKGIWQRNGCRGKNNKKVFSPDVEEFTEYYNSHSVQETADYYKKDRHTITHFAQKINIYDDTLKLTEEQKQEIIEAYYTDSSSTLSKKYNVSQSYITDIWFKADLKGKDNRVYSLDETFFDDIDSDEKAYWAGFIAADGCIYSPKDTRQKMISISLKSDDKKHLKKFAKMLKTDKPVLIGKHGAHGQYEKASIQISSNQLCKGLEKIGIKSNKTYDILWPKNLQEELYPAFLRGYFDGDDSISHNFEVNTLHDVNITIAGFKDNLIYFQQYLQSQGIKTSFIEDKRKEKYKTDKIFGCLSLSSKQEKIKFLHLIYDNASIYLDRKYLLAQKFLELCRQNPKTWIIK